MDSPLQPRRSLLRQPLNSTQNNQAHNLSITMLPEEQDLFRNTSSGAMGLLSRMQNRTMAGFDVTSMSGDSTLLTDNTDAVDNGVNKIDTLFAHFYEVLHTHNNTNDTLDVVQMLAQACEQVVEQLELEIDRGMGGNHGTKQREASVKWLKQEINTWRLLHALYYDRLLLQNDAHADDEMQEGPLLGGSEKEVNL